MNVTAEQADIIRATPEGGTCYLVVEGEMRFALGAESDDHRDAEHRPPADWAALAGACDHPHHDRTRLDGGWATCDRPDCIDGRKRTTLTVAPIDPGVFDQFAYDFGYDLPGTRGQLRRRLVGAQLWPPAVPLATVTVEVLPVVRDPEMLHGDFVIYSAATESCHAIIGGSQREFKTDRQPVPGRDFVVVLSDVRHP